MCNQKGGVGKTTTTINLGAALAEVGRKVLLVDFDPQGALSVGLGVPVNELDVTVYNLLVERGHDVRDVIKHTKWEGLDVLPANIDLSAAEVQLVGEVAREQILARVLRPVVDDYDVVLIDCQPSLGLLTVNALTAAHGVIIPLECEFFAMRGVALLDRDDREDHRPAQPAPAGRRHPRHDVRRAHPALRVRSWPASSSTSATRSSTPSSPHGEVPRRQPRGRADHHLRATHRAPTPTGSSPASSSPAVGRPDR